MLTREQLILRKSGIGGSDASAVVGLSKYATPLDVYLDKTTDVVKETTEAMTRGNVLEPFVKSLFEKETGWSVYDIAKTERHQERSYMIANLDGFLPAERAIVEFKTANYRTKGDWGTEGSDEIPKEYLIQVAHYASVMDLNTVHIGVLFGDESLFKAFMQLQILKEQHGVPVDLDFLNSDFRIYTYTRNRELERKLINKERAFWFDHIEPRIAPSVQDGCVDDILKAYPVAEDKEVCVGEQEIRKLQKLQDIKQKKKEIEEEENTVKADVMKIFGEASRLVDSSQTLLATWKNKTRTLFDKESLAKQYPDILKALTTKGTTRELRLI